MSEDILRVKLTAEGIQEVIGSLKKVETQTGKTAKAGKDAGDALGALGTLFAAQQIAAFTARALEANDQLGKLNQKTGIAVEQLSVFSYMAQQADVSQEDLGKGFGKLSKSLDALNKGDATAADAFKRIGLSAQDLAGLSLDQIFLKVANAQAGYADGAGKAAMMMTLFGRSGASLIPLMNDLANGGFENAKQKLQDLGLVITGDMAKAAQDFNDSMKRMNLAAQGATAQIAQTMLPGLTNTVDALTAALAGTPAGAKAMVGGFLLIGAAATATAVAVRSLGLAFASLGPAGVALVALSALTAGVLAVVGAQEEAHKKDLEDIATKGRMVQDGNKLVEQWRQEALAVKKSGDNKKDAAVHSSKMKEIEDQLIALSPAYLKTLKDEKQGIKEKADEMKRANGEAKSDLLARKAVLQQSISELDKKIASEQKYINDPGRFSKLWKKVVPFQNELATDVLQGLQQRKGVLVGSLKTLNEALGLEEPSTTEPPKKKKDPTAVDDSLIKAQAAALAAAAKRGASVQKQALDDFSALNDAFYKEGLIDLQTYLQAREAITRTQTANEIGILQAQMAAERSIQGTLKTPAEKMASAQKIADLGAQIKAKQAEGEVKLQALERTGEDLRRAAAQEALKLEGELEQAKGKTGEAAIKAIEAEYAERIRRARSDDAKKALAGLRDTAIGKAKVDEAGRQVQYAQTGLDMSMASVDMQRQAGVISEAKAVDLRTQAYEKWLPVIQQAAQLQLEAAQLVGDPAMVQAAEKQLQELDGMKLKLQQMKDPLKEFKDTAKDAFIDGFATFLETLADKTASLTDKMLALGFSIAQAVLKLAAMKVAEAAAGAMGFASGGPIVGPGTGTSDSIHIMASDGEFMVRAAAVQHYGVDTLAALNGLRLPRGLVKGYAEGGPISPGPSAIPVRGDFTHSMQIGLDEGVLLRILDSPEGAKVILKQASANSKKLNRALGRP